MTALLALVALLHVAAKVTLLAAAALVTFTTGVLDSPVILDTVSWGLLAGVISPLLISVVQRPNWSNRTRAIVGALVSVVVGVLTCLANGDLHANEGQTVLSTIAVVLVAAQATYGQLWKPTGVAKGIEKVTSPGASKAA